MIGFLDFVAAVVFFYEVVALIYAFSSWTISRFYGIYPAAFLLFMAILSHGGFGNAFL